jgi:hypothetical protein
MERRYHKDEAGVFLPGRADGEFLLMILMLLLIFPVIVVMSRIKIMSRSIQSEARDGRVVSHAV